MTAPIYSRQDKLYLAYAFIACPALMIFGMMLMLFGVFVAEAMRGITFDGLPIGYAPLLPLLLGMLICIGATGAGWVFLFKTTIFSEVRK